MVVPATESLAFEDAFDDLFALATRVAAKWASGPEHAADIAQDTMLKACTNWPEIAASPTRNAWVARAAVNRAISDWRRRQTVERFRHLVERPGPAGGPGDLVADRCDIAAALAQLPPRQRDVITLRYLADQSELDVADAIGCSVGSVRQHTARGLAALRTSLGVQSTEAFAATPSPHPARFLWTCGRNTR